MVTGFYRGFGASVACYAPTSAVWFATYEWTKKQLALIYDKHHDSTGFATRVHLASGALAGFTSSVFMNPLEVVKVRLQTLDSSVQQEAELLRYDVNCWYSD